ncbi:MAG: PLDc N-terminal domain-containing protein [Sulfitobacter sp.]|nr:PLDc N-terminal domain-containing protein [Sulfitobacter sp.]
MIGFITTHIEVVGVILLTLLVAFILLQQRRSPQSTAAWILFLVLLPYVAVPVFLALGFRKQSKNYDPILFRTMSITRHRCMIWTILFRISICPPRLRPKASNCWTPRKPRSRRSWKRSKAQKPA